MFERAAVDKVRTRLPMPVQGAGRTTPALQRPGCSEALDPSLLSATRRRMKHRQTFDQTLWGCVRGMTRSTAS